MSRNKSHEAIASFAVANRDSIYRLAYSYVRNKEDALDIVQDAIYKALSASKTLDDPARVRPWFYRIVINTALDYLRRSKRHRYLEVDTIDTAEPSAGDTYQDFDLRQALEGLSTANRTVIVLRFYEGLKLDEVASIMGENINTIKSRLYATLRKLRVELAEPDETAVASHE